MNAIILKYPRSTILYYDSNSHVQHGRAPLCHIRYRQLIAFVLGRSIEEQGTFALVDQFLCMKVNSLSRAAIVDWFIDGHDAMYIRDQLCLTSRSYALALLVSQNVLYAVPRSTIGLRQF
jgi:hypothetical protein